MKGQAWNVVETLKTPDHGPLELTRRARVCVWDDVVEIPIAVPLRAPSSEMRRKKEQHQRRGRNGRLEQEHEEMDITSLSTPKQKPQPDLLISSPPHENRFNLSRESSSLDIHQQPQRTHTIPCLVPTSPSHTSHHANSHSKPAHPSRMSYEAPRNYRKRHRRFSLEAYRDGEEDEGDLGYAANEDMDGLRKKVIVERLEMVKGRNPVFTWC